MKCLVVDTDILSAAGTKPNVRSESCSNTLTEIFNGDYTVVQLQQWISVRSQVARAWLTNMQSTKRIEDQVPENTALRKTISDFLHQEAEGSHPRLRDKRKAGIGKVMEDVHLLEAALNRDKTILSMDENTARIPFARAAKEVTELNEIVWANPEKAEDNVTDWLQRGAPNETHRLLKNHGNTNKQ